MPGSDTYLHGNIKPVIQMSQIYWHKYKFLISPVMQLLHESCTFYDSGRIWFHLASIITHIPYFPVVSFLCLEITPKLHFQYHLVFCILQISHIRTLYSIPVYGKSLDLVYLAFSSTFYLPFLLVCMDL